MSMATFCLGIIFATLYSGVEFGLTDASDLLVDSIVLPLLCVPTLYFISYRRTLRAISARAAGKQSGAGSKSDADTD